MSRVVDRRHTSQRKAALVTDVSNSEYIKPLVLTAVGGLILLGSYLSIGGIAGAAVGMAAHLVGLGIQVVLGLVALLIVTSLTGGGAGSLGLAVLRLAGIFTFCSGLFILLSALGCVGGLLVLAIMAFLFIWLFEFETIEAVAVVLVMIVLSIAIFVFLIPALFAVD